MKQWIKKLSGAVIASVLALTLSSKAYAEPGDADQINDKTEKQIENKIDEHKSDETPSENISNDPIDEAKPKADAPAKNETTVKTAVFTKGETTVKTDAAADGENTPEINAKAAPEAEPETVPEAAESEGGEMLRDSSLGESAPADTSATIVVVDNGTTTVIKPEEQTEVPETPDNDKDGFWGYDVGKSETPADDTLYMEDLQADSVVADNCDLHVESTGLNQIGSLTAENDLYISGTGIMLIDDLSINGCSVYPYVESPLSSPISDDVIGGFFLKPLGGSKGSVAVFLNAYSGSADDSGSSNTYVLINGRAESGSAKTGILDGQYIIPEGINLIMPSGTSINMTSSASSNGSYNSAQLTVPGTSSLTIDENAAINMSSTSVIKEETNAVTVAPLLNVEGTLSGDGSITGDGLVEINVPRASSPVKIADKCFVISREKSGSELSITYKNLSDELMRYVKLPSVLGEEKLKKLIKDKYGFIPDGDCWDLVFPVFTVQTDKSFTLPYSVETCNGSGTLKLFKWEIHSAIGGGDDTLLTSTSVTGSGTLGGKNAGAISLILKVTDKDTYYNLSAYLNGNQIFKLNSKVTVRFDYDAPAEEGQLFAVFRNQDGSLTAFPARYDAITGQLVFNSDKLGNFVVVCIDYNGKLYTKEFYDFLETIESVKNLKYGL